LILQVNDEAILLRSNSAWSGALVKITSIDDRSDEWGTFTIYNFEVLDKSLPEHDGRGTSKHPHMGATPFKSDFLEV
jgi:hypothetical protein